MKNNRTFVAFLILIFLTSTIVPSIIGENDNNLSQDQLDQQQIIGNIYEDISVQLVC